MDITTTGIVLHKVKYSESSIIVKILTRDAGVQSFIVKGAFSKQKRGVVALLENLSMVQVTFDDNRQGIKFWKEISLRHPYQNIPYDMVRRTIFIFYNELIYKLLKDFQADPETYILIEEALLELDSDEEIAADIHLRFMLRLAKQLGFSPACNYSERNRYFSVEEAAFIDYYIDYPNILSEASSTYLAQLLEADRRTPIGSKEVRKELLYGLIAYFQIHNEQIQQIASTQILSELLT